MTRTRLLLSLAALAVLGSILAVWAGFEARNQRIRTESSLRTQASVLAGTLEPALSAASAASKELDEIVAWKLLDNARLLGRIDQESPLSREDLEMFLETNDLDSIVVMDREGNTRVRAGSREICDLVASAFDEVVTGGMGEAILGMPAEESKGHLAAAVAGPAGGVVAVSAHESTAYAYAGRLGVENLLENTVGTGGILYLVYTEGEHGQSTEATWDGKPAPPPEAETGQILEVRDREVFEVRLDIPASAGHEALLRIGLEAEPLLQASVSAARRTALVGVVLAAFALAGTAFALVSRSRALEREVSLKRLADAEERKRRSERLAAAGTLAAGIAHEVRNPLNAISLAAQRLERQPETGPESGQFASRIRQEVGRLEEILEGFLDLAKPAGGQRTPTDLHALARDVATLLEPEASQRNVTLRLEDATGRVEADVDAEAVRRAMVNLVRNAIAASPPEGKVLLKLEQDGTTARFRVLDEGEGPEPEMMEQAFDPFVTTRAEGVGLGLPLVRRVAEEHGGWARLEVRASRGTEAVMELASRAGDR